MSSYAALSPHLEFLQIMQSVLTDIQHKKSLLHFQTLKSDSQSCGSMIKNYSPYTLTIKRV